MAKEFKKSYMHPTRRKLVDFVLRGDQYNNTTVGYDKTTHKHEIGETWEDGEYIKTQHDGWVETRSKNSDVFTDIRKYLEDKSKCSRGESCLKIKNKEKIGPSDKKIIKKTGYCSACLADFELQVKKDGLFDEYQEYRNRRNELAYFLVVADQMKQGLESFSGELQFVNEDGSIDKWSLDKDPTEFKKEMQEDYDKVISHIGLLKYRLDELFEILKEKNYEFF